MLCALNEKGNPVDWWFIYKVPKLGKGASTDQSTGYEYVYFDSTQERVLKSDYLLTSGKGALNLTLNSVFQNYKQPPANIGWVLYNDEMPSTVNTADNANLGHTKGVIAFDIATDSAFWLLHSWPKFADPSITSDPTPQYGQTYLCISLDLATARRIAAQMVSHQEPQTYYCRTKALSPDDPLYILARPLKPNDPADANSIDCKSKGGMDFKVIAKNRNWGKDFWNDLVGPSLNDDMDVDTWIRGPIPPIADSDGIHKTFDIKYINLGALGIHWAWPETHDHAKWGITLHANWVCVGDINRMISQRKRGGGAVAFKNETLWRALFKTNLLLAPPGHTREQARAIVHSTHTGPG